MQIENKNKNKKISDIKANTIRGKMINDVRMRSFINLYQIF